MFVYKVNALLLKKVGFSVEDSEETTTMLAEGFQKMLKMKTFDIKKL